MVLLQPAQLPMKVLLQPVVLARPAQLPMKVLLLPLVKAAPAFVPTRKLLTPEALREDGFVMHEENIFVAEVPHPNILLPPPPVRRVPLTYSPVALAHNLVHSPAAIITVFVRPLDPNAEPIMVLQSPVATL